MSKKTGLGPWHEVRRSDLHGNGVFARRPIPKGTYILEYEGVRITPDEADAQEPLTQMILFTPFSLLLAMA